MRLTVLGAASILAIALAACAKKDETTTAADTAATAEDAAMTEPADPAMAETEMAAEPTDVYAPATGFDMTGVRTKDALTAAADAAFAQADVDADGSLSQTEFYTLAAIMAPAEPMSESATDMLDDTTSAVGETVDGVIDEAAPMDETAPADASLDASYATLAGADASLTMDDLRSALLARFDAADANLDGALDDAEAAAFHATKLL